MQLILADLNPLDDVLPHNLIHFAGLHVTNQMFMALVAALLMLAIFPRLFAKPDSSVPTGAKNFFESILEFLRVEVFRPALKENTDRFVPFLWTMFFFILFCNLLGCIPLMAFFTLLTGGHVQYLGGAATGGISTTAALAICAFFFIHGHGIDQIARQLMNGTYGHHGHDSHSHHAHDQEHMRGEALPTDAPGDMRALSDPVGHYHDGERKPVSHEEAALAAVSADEAMTPVKAIVMSIPLYLWNFAPHPFRPTDPHAKWTAWIPDVAMWGVLLILELLGAMIKPLALCLRLFANMVAGHVLLAVLIGLIVVVPSLALRAVIGVPISALDLGIQMLELFVAFLQAYIFVFLTTLFIASAVAPEH
jgi:F0F1-type ATP synthase membrane subunit a